MNSTHHLLLGKLATENQPQFNQAFFNQALQEHRLILKFNTEHTQLFAYQPINLAAESGKIRPTREGVLMLNYSLDSALSRLKKETLYQAAIDLMIGLMTMLLLMAMLHRWLTIPLKYLTESAHRISEGDFKTPVALSGKGELAELGEAFNKMQQDLQCSIDDLKSQALALQISKENLSVTLNSIGDAVITTNASGDITGMNPVAEHLTGWQVNEARGQPLETVFNIVNSQTRSAAPNPVHLVIEHGNIVGLANHTSLISHNGDEFHIADSAAPIRNKSGEIDGVILVFHDVSEQYRKQALIAAHEAELRKITSILPGPVSHVDREGRYLFVSSAYESWFGIRSQDVMGLTQAEAIGPALYALFEPYFIRALKGESLTFDMTIPNPLGGIREVIVNIIPDLAPDAEVCGYFTIVTDITERKLAEQTALQLREQLAQANKMESVGHLTAGIAHDFNNMLGAILGYTELSQLVIATNKPSDVPQYLEEIVKASNRAQELISQMMTFSRLSPELHTGTAPITLVPGIVKEVVALLRSSIPATININYHIDADDLKSRIHAVNLHQIILNLGINARDAIGEYGTIDITLSRQKNIRQICSSCQHGFEGDFVKLSMRDTGSGIAATTLNKIFDPFFTTKGVGKGTGMGLSVVHGLVHAIGGHIAVESEIGKSTTINILLPLADSLTQHKTQPALRLQNQRDSNDNLAGLRIMVVDDELSMSSMMQEFLLIYGASPIAFNSPLAALAAFENDPALFDIVITDETMPGLSGMHLAARMLQLKPELPIILCTGFSENATPELALQASIAGFFYKPLRVHELKQKIQEIWQKRIVTISANNK